MAPIIIIEAPHRLDGTTSPAFGKFMLDLVEAGAHRVVLDLSALTYLGSAGLRALMITGQALATRKGRIALMACHPSVAEVLLICGLREDFPQVEGIEDARQKV